jgi:chemotaxis family two-component system response regulator Rcp1
VQTTSSKYILLAEDNPADVFLVRQALAGSGVLFNLRVVSDGDEALNFIDGLERGSALGCPELLLLDLHLPKRDGDEVLQRLRASARCGHTPVVILTSSDYPRDKERASQYSALSYFRKPSNLGDFMNLGQVVKSIVTASPSGDAPVPA